MKKFVIAALATVNGFFFLFELISKRLNGVGIDDSIFYHLFNMGQGAAYEDFLKEFLIAITGIAIILLLIYLCIKKLSHGYFGLTLIVLLAFITPFNNGITKTYQYAVLKQSPSRNLGGAEFIYNESAKVSTPKNLVYLYLESIENTYTNEEVFPGLTPNINRLKKGSIQPRECMDA